MSVALTELKQVALPSMQPLPPYIQHMSKKLFVLYAKKPIENHQGPIPRKSLIEFQDNSSSEKLSITKVAVNTSLSSER